MQNQDIIQKAVTILREGGLVAFPTETVYGLGADATNEMAIRKVFLAKERPYNHPLIVHIASIDQVPDWARDIPPAVKSLAEAFWPGPLTLILRKKAKVSDLLTGGQDTIGLRIPSHPVALALLQSFGGGIAAPSANKFTHISPTSADAVSEELGHQVDLILEGGNCAVGLESTIVDISEEMPVIYRPGMLTAAAIEKVLGKAVKVNRQDAPAIRVPGMHHVHYAPKTLTILKETQDLLTLLSTLSPQDLPIALMVRSTIDIKTDCMVIKMPADPTSYAYELYRTLRSLDHQGLKCIVIEDVPKTPEWEAVRDRLLKASA